MLTAQLTDVGLHESMSRYGDMALHAVVDLRRRFERVELERAAAATIADLPVLGCRFQKRAWRDCWVELPRPLAELVHVVEEPADLEAETLGWVRRPIVLGRERPWRVVSLGRDGGSRLILSVMHVATDGGGSAALGHVFGSHLYGVAPSAPVSRRRDLGHALGGLRPYHLPWLARGVLATLLEPLRSLASGPRERAYPARVGGEPCWRHLTVGADDLAALKRRCRVSVNDLLVAALARVVAERSSWGPATVMYTMDLRRYAAAPALTVANTSSIMTVHVPRGATGSLERAAAAVARLTAAQRRGLAGPAYLLTPMMAAAGAPHGLARRVVHLLHPIMVDLPLGRGLMVTNVGRLDEGLGAFGDDIERIRLIGPNVDSVPIPAVVAFGFRDELHLELFAPPCVAPAALAELEGELRRALSLPAG
jgi:NRPS condensation-like uncharacterized protein